MMSCSSTPLPLVALLLCAFVRSCVGSHMVSAGAGVYTRNIYGIEDRSVEAKGSGDGTGSGGKGQIPFLASVYRNVSRGSAWVLPANAFDLTFRSLGCECFDPSSELSSVQTRRACVWMDTPTARLLCGEGKLILFLVDEQSSAAWPRPSPSPLSVSLGMPAAAATLTAPKASLAAKAPAAPR